MLQGLNHLTLAVSDLASSGIYQQLRNAPARQLG